LPDWRLTFGDESNPRKAGLPYPPVGQRDQLVVKTIEYLFDLGQRPEDCLIVPLQPDLRSARMLQQGACFTMHMPGCPAINEDPTNSKRFRIPSSSVAALDCHRLRTVRHIERVIQVDGGLQPVLGEALADLGDRRTHP
jgi:hypothetical protein